MCSMHHKKSKRSKRIFMVLMIPVMVFGLGAAVWLLWNWLMPDIFGLKELTYWQALGLLVLSKLLLGGFGGFRKRGGHHPGPPRHIREKFMNMTDEEKAAFKAKMRKRWHGQEEQEEEK